MPVPPEVTSLVPVIAKAFAQGRIVPFLGAGASLIGRDAGFAHGSNLPTGGELADYLALRANYPGDWEKSLTRVSQFMLSRQGSGPLYSELRDVFTVKLPPNPLHALLAGITLRSKSPPATIVITTNYDNLVENAMTAAGVAFDILTYVANGDSRGRFRHTTSDGTVNKVLEDRNYTAIPFNKALRRLERPLVLKIHGTVSLDYEEDSYVITEQDYIEYLARKDVSDLLPTHVAEILAQKHFLFLGYSLSDWNLRVLLSRIWQRQRDKTYHSWAFNRKISEYDSDFWKKYDVECNEVELGDFTSALAASMDTVLGTTPP